MGKEDFVDGKSRYSRGDGRTSQDVFERNFAEAGLALPVIHKGWFAESEYRKRVSFAFFDGDTYQSILDSFRVVWPRMNEGGVIVVHDYGYHEWPGVAVAVREWCEPRGVKWVKGLSHTCRIVVP